LGHVYESLIAEEERGRSGIFYTQPTELYFMCRRALIEHLDGQVPLTTEEIIQLVLEVETPDELPDYDPTALAAVRQRLDEVKVVDPACGSGAFLVTIMNVIARLHEFIAMRAGQKLNAFDLKRKIIADNLYGVDIKEWACRVAELRLWLSLIVETEGHHIDMYTRPLLPNLDYKIRQGDSLVEEIEGQSLSLRGKFSTISRGLAQKINRFIRRKDDYFYNRDDRKVMIADIERLETEILRDVVDSKLEVVNRALGALESLAAADLSKQLSFLGEEPVQPGLFEETENARKARERRRDRLAEEKARLLEARAAVGKKREREYFFWDIDFAEVFQEQGGFDIVIGNPPYVRQESIAPQNLLPDEITPGLKREYKEQLVRSVHTLWGKELKVDKRSDLYVYFYFHGLGLLRPGGVFCFITSNSWLDVGYGACLQRFLLERMKVKAIYDNRAKRSFAESDVNTVISLFQRPERGEELADHSVRFVAFKRPFEDAVTARNLTGIQAAQEGTSTEDYRLRLLTQGQLLLEGSEKGSQEVERPQSVTGPLINVARYIGDKWGGKYLRAPDIYFTILEKGKGKLVRLGDIAQVRFGVKTGANKFFYLDEERIKQWGIREEFLRPVIKSPREARSIFVNPSDLSFRAFMCHKEKSDLRNSAALEYIKWGESQGFHERPSCRNRARWYDLGDRDWARVLWPMIHNDRSGAYLNPHKVVVDHNLFEVVTVDVLPVWASLFWIGQTIFRELFGRVSLGQGALKTEGIDISRLFVVDPRVFDSSLLDRLQVAIEAIGRRPLGNVFRESGLTGAGPFSEQDIRPLSDRAVIDNVVFDLIGLDEKERETTYRMACHLVRERLSKARSI